jgi:hypothetical protein
MQTEVVKVDCGEARRLYRIYKEHLHYSTPIDDEIRRTYQLIAQGKTIIKALESIKVAGLNAQGWPKLAIAPADALSVECRMEANGAARFDGRASKTWIRHDAPAVLRQRSLFKFPRCSFPGARDLWSATALVPGIPLHLRPQRGIANYHILWEAEWTKIVPHDPFLLRRIGKADLWLVVAAWDLTEVERAALATRL